MTHNARGVDENGILQVDIVINGEVPDLPPAAKIRVLPYTENYIQTGPGEGLNPRFGEEKVNLWNQSVPVCSSTTKTSDVHKEKDILKTHLKTATLTTFFFRISYFFCDFNLE